MNKTKYISSHVAFDKNDKSIKLYIKKIDEENIVFVRKKGCQSYQNLRKCWTKIESLIEKYNLKTTGFTSLKTSYYNYPFKSDWLDYFEFSLTLDELPDEKYDFIKTNEKYNAVTCYHLGSIMNIFEKYEIMKDFIIQNNYDFKGALINSFILHTPNTIDEEKFITEVIIPIERF